MDSYFSTNLGVHRLYSEWEKHKKLIVACDFDETVFDFHVVGTKHDMVLELLRECSQRGFYIVIFTASVPERYDFIREFMEHKGITISGINKNPVVLPFGNHGKIYYNILLDDRAGLGQAYTTLATVIQMIKVGEEQGANLEANIDDEEETEK